MTDNNIPSIVALIPARAGSKRVPGKNIRRLDGHPLLAYSIAAALASDVFDSVIVSTDSEEYARIAQHYGAEVPFLRPPEYARDLSPDIEWVEYTLSRLKQMERTYQCFSILRPTSPFRQADTIRRAWREFLADDSVDSLRAVEKCKQHPGKMWVVRGTLMEPLLQQPTSGHPWHSMQYQSLPVIYVQNASLEIAWMRVVTDERTIAGQRIRPFFTQGFEGVDVNLHADWQTVEQLVMSGQGKLPVVDQNPYPSQLPD